MHVYACVSRYGPVYVYVCVCVCVCVQVYIDTGLGSSNGIENTFYREHILYILIQALAVAMERHAAHVFGSPWNEHLDQAFIGILA